MTGRHSYERDILFDYLRRSPIFSACTNEQLELVEAQLRFEQRHPGDAILRQGEAGHELHVLVSGKARVERDGHEVASLGPGAFFGELALFDPAPRDATVTAVADATTVVLHRDAFRELLAVPGVRDEVLRGMARRLHELDAKA